MTDQHGRFDRRTLLRGAIATAAIAPLSSVLAACAGGGSDDNSSQPTGKKSDTNPFGLADTSKIEAVIFNGGYGYDYVTFAADQVKKEFSGASIKVSPSTKIATELQPRFVGGTPPDLIDNSGADLIGFNTIADQLETLDDVFDANNYEGTKIADTLYPNVKVPGTYDGNFVALNYVMTVYAVWYSASLFQENGWTAPKTFDEALDLGAKAKAKGKYLWVWGKEAATYYRTLAIDSAAKEGGDEVRLALENLDKNAWSHPAVQGVIDKLGEMVKQGMFVPGGAGTQFTAAQAKWSQDQQALLYPSGGWIENEMKDATKADFQMTGIPEMTLTAQSSMPYEAIRAAAGEGFIVPKKAKNVAGGKEMLRAMLSKDAATNFSKTKLAPTIVKGIVPADGFGSAALKSQSAMLDAAGDNVFNFQFYDYYGTNSDELVIWNSFLAGDMDAKTLTKKSQEIFDKVANDSSVKKLKIT
ncbi:carbohydrate ABC transporter substrate-binding protein, CUT1 family (TC 3.A.1.1.-) [Nocardioides terrae]|uniref:Carbohydrate ABC transporter substrate-binding protein, CUT1 family (TC 3.A.1.1.-) n=1 Tax=Nocardioides terrae TaxID=574651 RepID=A0A1I1MNA5_9ACTN|nr:N-acetylglucosamine/diacetylchitobiose ABC transporter substrate-binding protein [Nocardioides terrae]SFC84678.1 carbohydrate ABC transporter substrate-binding protein, CUT1 family (TC 3.A.1.1.-) [Nocardioides terrae]